MKVLYKKLFFIAALLFSLLGNINEAKASHVTGVNFYWECLGQDSFYFQLNVFRDCSGISLGQSFNFQLENSCGTSFSVTSQLATTSGVEISMLCSQQIQNSSCTSNSSSALTGMEVWVYEAWVKLPNGCSGDVSANAQGGSPGYAYNWPLSRFGPDQDNLCAGRYVLTVTDANGCEAYDTLVFNDASGLDMNVTVNEITCSGLCDASITVAGVSGTPPYAFTWNDGTTTATRSNLCPGNYTVTVMDADRNQFRQTVRIDNTDPVIINHLVQDESCSGANNGYIFSDIQGGTQPYTLTWTGGLSGSKNTNVAPGTYTLNVTDANGCTASAAVTVQAATPINVTVAASSPISCNGACDGILTATATGGVAPYTYLWSNGDTSATADSLCVGTHLVEVMDANGCISSQTFTLTSNPPITLTPTVVNTACGASTGSITIAASGGAGAPFTYSWTGITPNPGNVNTVTGLAAGVYTVDVTDNTGCNAVMSIAVTNTTGPTGSGAVVTDATCFGGNNGSVVLAPTGGTAPYTYLWSTGGTTNSITGVTAGEYYVTITDAVGCSLVEIINVGEPNEIMANETIVNPSCYGNANGSINVAPSGGTGAYSVLWLPSNQTGNSISNITAGQYIAEITDANGCVKYDTFNVTEPDTMVLTIASTNPILCSGDCSGSASVSVAGGTAPYTYVWSSGSNRTDEYGMCAGTYTVTVTDANGCTATQNIIITAPTAISTNIVVNQNVGCCGHWRTSWSTCCRNAGVTNLLNPGGAGVGAIAYFNAALEVNEPCDNGVFFENDAQSHPIRYICLGDTVCYNFGVVELDGDSLYFEWTPPITNTANPPAQVNFAPGYSYNAPIPGITLDNNTGEVCFTAGTVGLFVVAVKVTEYDPVSGLWRGESTRDIQFSISACPDNAYPELDTVSNFFGTGGASMIGMDSIGMCEGDSISFQVVAYDSNYNTDSTQAPLYIQSPDTLMYMFSNVTSWMPGATMTTTDVDSVIINNDTLLRLISTITWVAPPGSGNSFNFYVGVNDDHCEIPAEAFRTIHMNISDRTIASPDAAICGNQQTQLGVTGGTQFGWSVLYGDPIQIGFNFSCDSCDSPIASPSVTTAYLVTSNLSAACQNTDTVIVTVTPDFNLSAGPDTILCAADSIQMYVTPSVPGNYTYAWNNSATLDNDTIPNPVAAPLQTTFYTVTVTSDLGCEKFGGNAIQILPPFPFLNIVASDTMLCDGDTALLDLVLGTPPPANCGPSPITCTTSFYDETVGSSTLSNGTTGWPAPYGGSRRSARHQFLYRANELTAMGLSAGMITAIGFEIANMNNSTTSYDDFEIKIGCTSTNSLSSGGSWLTGLSSAFGPSNYTISSGWNMHSLTTPYYWDGTSNLIIEVCFDNTSSSMTQNASTYYYNPNFACTYYVNSTSNTSPVCGNSGFTPSMTFLRPVTKFEFCGSADSTFYQYSWTPGATLSDSTVKSPLAYPTANTLYEVVVQDTFGICSDTASVDIYVADMSISEDTTVCEGDSIQLFSYVNVSCPSGGSSYSWSPGIYFADSTAANPMVAVDSTTTFVLTYTDSCNCDMYDTVTVFVNNLAEPGSILTPPNCGASDGEIEIEAIGGFAPYMFSIDSGATFQVDSVFDNLGPGIYNLAVTDSLGCPSPVATEIFVNPLAPVIDSVTITNPNCAGSIDGVIEVHATGGVGSLTYTIDSLNYFPSNVFNNLDSGTYFVQVRDSLGCANWPDEYHTLTTNPPVVIDTFFVTDILCNGDNTGQIVMQSSGGVMPHSYSIDNGNTYQSTPAFDSLTAGTYVLYVRDNVGCVSGAQLTTINEPSAMSFNLLTENDTCYQACGGKAEVIVAGGTGSYNYAWSPINFGNTNQLTNLCAGSYNVMVTDSFGCQRDTTFAISEPSELVIDSVVVTNISCNGLADGAITVHAQGGVQPYLFSIDSGATYQNVGNFSNLTAGVYYVFVKDSNDRCYTNTVALLTEPSPVVLSTNWDSTKICVSNCVTGSVSVNGGQGGPFSYVWNGVVTTGPTQPICPTADTAVAVYAFDANGCQSNTRVLIVDLFDSLRVDAGADKEVCPGESAQLFANVTGGDGSGYNYSWTPTYALDNAFIQNPVATVTSDMTYTVNVLDNCGSPSVSDVVTVSIAGIPVVDFVTSDSLGCEPFDAEIINQSTLVGSSIWTIGDDYEIAGMNARVKDLTAGTYDVKLVVTSPVGCVDSLTKTDFITVLPKPKADFVFDPEETTEFETLVQFTDMSEGELSSWQWNFAGLSTSNIQNPIYQFPSDSGTYPITLTVTSDEGCIDDTVRYLQVSREYNFYMPNSFTPNGDDHNNVLRPYGIGIDTLDFAMEVYNRWGELIYETNDFLNGWDGTIMGTGEIVPVGVYVVKVHTVATTKVAERREYVFKINVIK